MNHALHDIHTIMPLVSSNPDHVEMARLEKELEASKAAFEALNREYRELKIELSFTNRMIDKLIKASRNGY